MKISLNLDDTTYDLVLRKAITNIPEGKSLTGKAITKGARRLILETIMEAFPSDVCLCERCGKAFSVEADEGSLREEGAFCNKHLPEEER